MNLMDATLVVFVREGPAAIPEGISAWCRTHGYSRATVCRHLARIRAEGAYQERSRRPHGSPLRTPKPVRDLVIETRTALAAQPGLDLGADVIRAALQAQALQDDWKQRGWVVPARSTIHKILRDEGLVEPAPKKRPKSSYRRFCYARPRDCYQIDGTDVSDIVGFPAVVIEVLDDHSRMLVGSRAGTVENGALACEAIGSAFAEYGVAAIVLADNGLAFSDRFATSGGGTRFTRKVRDAGARLIHSSPYHPQTCGKCERHHQTFKKWLRAQPRPANHDQLQALCDQYRLWYNTERWHSVWKSTPAAQWNAAPELGAPTRLPLQQDALVLDLKVNAGGCIYVRKRGIYIGRSRYRDHLTAIVHGNHVTIYEPTGHPLGHLTLDYTRTHQGKLTAA